MLQLNHACTHTAVNKSTMLGMQHEGAVDS
jgi:hypothetical protein